MNKKKTDELINTLKDAHVKDIDIFMAEHESEMLSERPFAAYMRPLIKRKGFRQQEVFVRADVPDRYGYKIISEQKKTRQRDVILRICYAAEFTLEEVQEALKLYQMPQLYIRIPRDAVLIFAFQNHHGSIHDVNNLLIEKGMEPLHASGNQE